MAIFLPAPPFRPCGPGRWAGGVRRQRRGRGIVVANRSQTFPPAPWERHVLPTMPPLTGLGSFVWAGLFYKDVAPDGAVITAPNWSSAFRCKRGIRPRTDREPSRLAARRHEGNLSNPATTHPASTRCDRGPVAVRAVAAPLRWVNPCSSAWCARLSGGWPVPPGTPLHRSGSVE